MLLLERQATLKFLLMRLRWYEQNAQADEVGVGEGRRGRGGEGKKIQGKFVQDSKQYYLE